MYFTRRQFAGLATAFLLPGIAHAADAENALFWRVQFPTYEITLFGYARLAAAFVPEIVAEGKRLIDNTQAIVLDVNADVQLSTADFDRHKLGAILAQLDSSQQAEFRKIVARSPMKDLVETLSGIEAAFMLLVEGQHTLGPSAPGIGEELMGYGATLKRPITRLLDDDEVRAVETPLTLEKARSVGSSQIGFLLDLRRRIGPIGAHFDELYKARRSAEIAALGEEIDAKGVILPPQIDQDRLRLLVLDRLASLRDGMNAFTMLPISILSGRYSILEELRSRGAKVTVIS